MGGSVPHFRLVLLVELKFSQFITGLEKRFIPNSLDFGSQSVDLELERRDCIIESLLEILFHSGFLNAFVFLLLFLRPGLFLFGVLVTLFFLFLVGFILFRRFAFFDFLVNLLVRRNELLERREDLFHHLHFR